MVVIKIPKEISKHIKKYKYLICVFFWLCFVTIADNIYTKFFETIPVYRTKVSTQLTKSSMYRVSPIELLHFELTPNFSNGKHNINSLGMRDDEPSLDKYRVIVLGDSVTFGEEINQDDLYTEVTQKILVAQEYQVDVMNAAVPSYNTKQELIAFKNKFLSLHPNLVIFAYSCNDMGDIQILYKPGDIIQKKLQNRKQSDQYYDLTSQEYLALKLPQQFFLPYNIDRWFLLHSSIYRIFSLLSFKQKNNLKNPGDFVDILSSNNLDTTVKEIKELSKEYAFLVKFFILPGPFIDKEKKSLITSLDNAGIEYWDFDFVLRQELKTKIEECFLAPGSAHMTVKGHKLIGELLSKKIKNILDYSNRSVL
ncbi:MAG: SGNH/GDSL hydrolase family protein [Candidatus Omnitrophota bacterium]